MLTLQYKITECHGANPRMDVYTFSCDFQTMHGHTA